MSEEKKNTWNFHLVYTDLNDEQVAKLHELTHKELTPDIIKQFEQVRMIMQFLVSYTNHVYTQCQAVNFDIENENFSNHPKVVLNDIKARSEFIIQNYKKLQFGQLVINELNKIPLEDLIEVLVHVVEDKQS